MVFLKIRMGPAARRTRRLPGVDRLPLLTLYRVSPTRASPRRRTHLTPQPSPRRAISLRDKTRRDDQSEAANPQDILPYFGLDFHLTTILPDDITSRPAQFQAGVISLWGRQGDDQRRRPTHRTYFCPD